MKTIKAFCILSALVLTTSAFAAKNNATLRASVYVPQSCATTSPVTQWVGTSLVGTFGMNCTGHQYYSFSKTVQLMGVSYMNYTTNQFGGTFAATAVKTVSGATFYLTTNSGTKMTLTVAY